MQKTTADISARQLFFVTLMITTVTKVLTLPAALAAECGRDAWLALLGLIAADAVVFAGVMLCTLLAPQATLSDLLGAKRGKNGFFNVAVHALLFTYLILRCLSVAKEVDAFLFSNLFDTTMTWAPIFPAVVAGGAFAAYKGLRAVARTTELGGVLLAGLMMVGLVLSALGARYQNLLPVALKIPESGRAVWKYLFHAGDTAVLIPMLGRMKREQKIKRVMLVGFSAGIVTTFLYDLLFVAFYGNLAAFVTRGRSMSDMAQSFIGGQGLLRMDVLVNLAWMAAALLKIMLIMWAAGACVHAAIPCEQTPRSKALVQGTLCALLIAAYFLLSDAQLHRLFTGWARYIMPAVLSLTVLLPLLAARRRKKTETEAPAL
ncbi:MAG: spore germination protein [Clostridiales bacterium]|jgi:hypothetical protein|nr:spore germination protein [Clostridiales bacterium]